jgi:hypothetical protein
VYVLTSVGVWSAVTAACVFVTSDLAGEISFGFGPKYWKKCLGSKRKQVTEDWRKLRQEELHDDVLQTLFLVMK